MHDSFRVCEKYWVYMCIHPCPILGPPLGLRNEKLVLASDLAGELPFPQNYNRLCCLFFLVGQKVVS